MYFEWRSARTGHWPAGQRFADAFSDACRRQSWDRPEYSGLIFARRCAYKEA